LRTTPPRMSDRPLIVCSLIVENPNCKILTAYGTMFRKLTFDKVFTRTQGPPADAALRLGEELNMYVQVRK